VKKIWPLALILLTFESGLASNISLKQLLSIRPGESLNEAKKKIQGLKPTDSIAGASYSIEAEGDVVTSVKIDFSSPVSSQEMVTAQTKGHCLVQPMGRDIAFNRVFFFDVKKQIRYEVNPKGLIKSILVQDIPGARANRECQFSEVAKPAVSSEAIKKVE